MGILVCECHVQYKYPKNWNKMNKTACLIFQKSLANVYLEISSKTVKLFVIIFAIDQLIEDVLDIRWWHKSKTCKHAAEVCNHWIISIILGQFVFCKQKELFSNLHITFTRFICMKLESMGMHCTWLILHCGARKSEQWKNWYLLLLGNPFKWAKYLSN